MFLYKSKYLVEILSCMKLITPMSSSFNFFKHDLICTEGFSKFFCEIL